MHYRRTLLILTTLLLFLIGCAAPPQPLTTTVETTQSLVSTTTAQDSGTDSTIATVDPIPTDIVDRGNIEVTAVESSFPYIDDRSSAESVLRSLFNAINSRQYVRAYGYWEPGTESLPSFAEFEQSFVQTDYVELFHVGEVLTATEAEHHYFAVPYIISVTNTDDTGEAFAGCYLMHLTDPALQSTPPFQPLAIRSAAIQQMGEGDDSFTISATLCETILASQ